MTKIFLFITAFFLFASCDSADQSTEPSTIDMQFTQFDVTLSSGEVSVGLIDNDNFTITLTGIEEPLNIKSVTYAYSDEVTLVTPTPESKIGTWSVTEQFRLHSGGGYQDYTVTLPDFQERTYESQATISPLETFGVETKYHMIDLNANPSQLISEAAYTAYGQGGMNGIRFPLYCGDYYGGHPEPGVVVESVYEKPLQSLENAKNSYYGSEPFLIFVGIKCMTSDKNEYYPDWVSSESDYIKPGMYAQMIVDFIEFMDQKGYEIYGVAIDKEGVRMGVDDFKESVDSIRAMTARLGYLVPKIVAPELWKPNGNTSSGYMNTLYSKGYEARYDIFGNHYYPKHHSLSVFTNLEYEYNLAQTDKARPYWATEPHWDGDAVLWVTEDVFSAMFVQTDLGMEAFMWWSYPLTGSSNVKGPIMRAYSDAILRSTPIRMLDHDGEEVFTKGKLQTRAYLRDNEVNVFLINVVNPDEEGLEAISYEDYAVGILDGYSVDGKVLVRQWREGTEDDTSFEGEVRKIDPVSDNQFLIDIPSGSFTQLTFNITE